MVELRGLRAGYSGREVLHGVSLTFRPRTVLALLGPNGCGKSTLLRAAMGLVPKSGGEILYDGKAIENLSLKERALKVAYLAQSRETPNITARRMVLHGRFPHLSYPRVYRRRDLEMVDWALTKADASELADWPMPTLSGGQRQKVYLAMALAQDTPTILMDEPTTYLDIGHQLDTLRTARCLAGEGRSVVLVLHDLCHALRTADEIALLSGGSLVFSGTPEEAYTSGALEQVFGVRLGRAESEAGWQYYCL